MLGKYTAQTFAADRPVTGRDVNGELQKIESAVRGVVAIPPQTLTTNQTLALGVADLVEWTVGGPVTIALDGTKTAPGTTMIVALTQDGTGNRAITFTGVTWIGGSAPANSTPAGARDVYLFVSVKGLTNALGIPLGPNLVVNTLTAKTVSVEGGTTWRGNHTYPGTAIDVTPSAVIPNNGTLDIGDVNSSGLLFIQATNLNVGPTQDHALISLLNGIGATVVASAIRGTWGNVTLSGASYDVVWVGGATARYRIENRSGGDRTFAIVRFGNFPS